jgi:hypothetical protein
MFEPLELFTSLMDRVRQVRNILAHFRGSADQIQDSTLKYAVDWLSTRAGAAQTADGGPKRVTITQPQARAGALGKRYDPLKEWLSQQEQTPTGLTVNFRDLETLLSGPLPAAARKHQSWWSSNPNEAQSRAWLEAGWRVSQVNLPRREVTFQPAGAQVTPQVIPQVTPQMASSGASPTAPAADREARQNGQSGPAPVDSKVDGST